MPLHFLILILSLTLLSLTTAMPTSLPSLLINSTASVSVSPRAPFSAPARSTAKSTSTATAPPTTTKLTHLLTTHISDSHGLAFNAVSEGGVWQPLSPANMQTTAQILDINGANLGISWDAPENGGFDACTASTARRALGRLAARRVWQGGLDAGGLRE
ncbi:hypothetical protein BU26DRAFT_504110 [Trematosphaeria pertusa]|uniref:Uncharacterized protein n=1 Tax=Trematosphaeria pertusa TaxID=390896 RepID=A0A6A6IJA3_9PLEO|nr:uncharacterized protein BU26DRAFT_504110 [Trematosphaeria pertusa]KAF2249650.1 hypothetical protein BU26DRAFT_504110 [Trematosphaeria pertusa]